eukprot:scaffold64407_cov24-Tisochrysis_lutea.AAC.4
MAAQCRCIDHAAARVAARPGEGAPAEARWSFMSGIRVRYMSASTAHRCTAGGTLASRRPSVAERSLVVGSIETRWSGWRRQTLASATAARARTLGLGDLRSVCDWTGEGSTG